MSFNSSIVHSIVYVEQTQQMQQFYEYNLFFIHQLLLHISACMCHNQGTRMRILSYVSRQCVVDKVLEVLSGPYYVAAWRVFFCPFMYVAEGN
jgi:uncharacterized protein YqkB